MKNPCSFEFMVNLNAETASAQFQAGFNSQGYLLAPANISPAMIKTVRAIAGANKKIFVDNGNFSIIGVLAAEYRGKADKVLAPIQAFEKTHNRKPAPQELPRPTIQAIKDLALRVQARCHQLTPDDKTVLSHQSSVDATHFIGCEDITMASWLCLNLEPEYLGLPQKNYRALNHQVAERVSQLVKTLEKRIAKNFYPVASSMSYDTAFDAGQEFAQAEIVKVAMGFGAYSADANFCDAVVIKGKRIALPESLPARHLRIVLTARGFWEGYRAVAGKSPQAFHFLGLGTPLFMALCALLAQATPEVTFDATSPLKDAVAGTLYVSKPAFLKIKTMNVAQRLATTPSARWDCPCPFCQNFVKQYPFDYQAGIRGWQRAKRTAMTSEDLKPSGILFKAFPLFSEPGTGPLRKAINFTRMGHNHWIIREMTDQLTAAAKERKQQTMVQKIIADYSSRTKSQTYSQAAQYAFQLATIKDLRDFKTR